MKLRYATANGRLTFEADPSTPREAFEFLASVQEAFEESCCGACGSENVRYEVREFEGVKGQFFKLVCRDCRAQLDYGLLKDGKGIFPKRRGEDGHALPDDGWYHYRPPHPPAGDVPREAPAPPPAKGARPAPPAAADPTTGAELLRRVSDYEARLVAAGRCRPGELMRQIVQAGAKAGHGPDVARWPQEAVALAAEAVRIFEAGRRKASPAA